MDLGGGVKIDSRPTVIVEVTMPTNKSEALEEQQLPQRLIKSQIFDNKSISI